MRACDCRIYREFGRQANLIAYSGMWYHRSIIRIIPRLERENTETMKRIFLLFGNRTP
jgi:hypothetical protein